MSKADRLRASVQAAVKAVVLEGEVREWLRVNRKSEAEVAGSVLAMARNRGAAFEAEVQRQFKPSKAAAATRIIADSRRQLGQDLKALGVNFVQVPDEDKHLGRAVAALVSQIDVGSRRSASAAAKQPGLDAAQARKLGKQRVKREAVSVGICINSSSPFVARLREVPPLLAIVEDAHEDLAALARRMHNVQKALKFVPGAPAAGQGVQRQST